MSSGHNSSSTRKGIPKMIADRRDIIKAILAELIGTAILVIFTCGTCAATGEHFKNETLVSTSLSFGLTVMCLCATLGHVSGCHVNPGVTIGLLANGQVSIIRAVLFIISQVIGGVCGASILAGILKSGSTNLCVTKLHGLSPLQGIIVEFFIVFLLVFVVCNVCESNSNLAPISIGLAVACGHLFAIPLTSSSMNPARSFGPALIQNKWDNHYVYWIGPLIGGAFAGLTHRYLFPNKTFYNTCKIQKHSGDPSDVTTTI